MTSNRPVAVITGGATGMGKAITLAMVKAGFDVVATSRNTKELTSHDGVTFFDLDVSSDESVSLLVQQVIGQFGRIDVLINNAGMGLSGAAEENSIAQAQRVFDINFFGVMRMTNAVLPHMRARGRGRIVNISSVFGFMPAPFMAVYSGTKHALEGYSESLDHEVRGHGIRVTLVEPAGTRTGFENNSPAPENPLDAYAVQRQSTGQVLAKSVNEGDDPAAVAKVIVTAATGPKPKLRYTIPGMSRRLSTMRRLVPARAFDKSLRTFFKLSA